MLPARANDLLAPLSRRIVDPLRAPLFNDTYIGIPVDSSHIYPMPGLIRSLRVQSSVDSLGQVISLTYNLGRTEIFFPLRMPLWDFVDLQGQARLRTLWRQTLLKKPREYLDERRRREQGVRIDLPVEFRSRTFQTLFGGSRVGLSVTGDITIDGGFRHEKRSEVKTALTRGSDYNFKMEQKQRFGVEGHIGEKVSVRVDQDSERPFDFENTIRLDYKGYEDEVVTSIEAGNISLSLPATRFVTFSGRNSGLFGVKADMQLGNLRVTTIASQEKGESKRISLSGGAEQQTQRIEDYQYRRGAYFFLDRYYRNQFRYYDKEGNHLYNPSWSIRRIELYKSEPGYDTRYSDSIRGWAVIDERPDQPGLADSLQTFDIDTSRVDQNHYFGYFRRLEKTEYFVDTDLGYVQLNNPVGDGEVLAVAYETHSGRKVGDIDFDPQTQTTIILRILKSPKPTPKDSTWDLEWKNVYYLGATNIQREGFSLKIFYKPPSGDPEETQVVDGKAKTYLQIFGLDRFDLNGNPNPDGAVDIDPNILNLARGELIFPDLRPFDPLGVYIDGQLVKPELSPDRYSPTLYDTTSQAAITAASKFYIEVRSQNKSATYQLGFNLIEGSEEVRLNGRPLQRGTDYVIDYYTGTLTILNEQATLPTADVQISYESNELFQLEKKTLVGTRAQYDFGTDRFIGASFLYLNQSTLDRKIRVGQGPMRNFIWDVNGKFGFQPYFLTQAVNLLPFVDTQAPSSVNIEGEIAQILPNPNTRNNEATGDPSGVAYIDDFEGSKRTIGLSITRRAWTLASAPVGIYPDVSRMGRIIWYNPWEQVYIKDIWPNRDINPNVPQRVHVLSIEFTPADSTHLPVHDPYYFPLDSSWAGIMQSLSAGYHDQTESKFLEIMVQGDEGILHIDLGQISEDVIPNGRLDTEDKAPPGGFRNGLLDPGEDVGLDGMDLPDPLDFWDLNRNGRRDRGEPLSFDDWHYSPASFDYSRINGTQGNENDEGGRRPDTEDINGNGAVDLSNNYFEYTINLAKDSPDTAYISGGNPEKGWWQYRIPLADLTHRKDIGNPDFTRIEAIRIWINGVKNRNGARIRIAEINLVGSDWKELGIASPLNPDKYDARDDTTVAVTVVNTHDNPEYRPPPGVSGEIDPITRVQAREQALVLKINDLKPGYSGLIQKTFYSAQDYLHYEKMKMYVFGKDPAGTHIRPDSSYIELFFRFGSDLKNYYELRQRVYPGWDKRNEIVIDLLDLAAVKLDSAYYDSTSGEFVKVLLNGKEYRIRGRPSLTNVRMLAVGVRNLMGTFSSGPGSQPLSFTGEVWLNELRLSYVKKERGMAMRAHGDVALADVLRLSADIDRQDADFHDIKSRYGSGDNRISTAFNASLQLDKLLPSFLGLSIPITYNERYAEATPKYKPGTDIELRKGHIPREVLETVRSRQEQRGFSVSLRRATQSKNWLIANTLDRVSASYSETESHSSSSTILDARSVSRSGRISYNLSFARGKALQPFSFLGSLPILGKLAATKFYYKPSNFSLDGAFNQSDQKSVTRTGAVTGTYMLNVSRSVRATYQMLDNLNFDYSRSYASDMLNSPLSDVWKLKLGQTTAISQTFSAKYSPKIFAWLTHSFSYSSNFQYNNNLQQKTTGRSAANSANFSASFSLDPSRLWNSVFRPTAPAGRPMPGRQPPGVRRAPPPGAQGQAQPSPTAPREEKPKDSKGGSPLSVLSYVGKFFGMFDPISLNLQQRKGASRFGLAGEAMPTTDFQFGFSLNPGVPSLQNVGTNRGAENTSTSLSLQTGLRPMRTVGVDLRYTQSEQENRTTTVTGGSNRSYLRLGDLDMPFPSWTIRWSGLERWKFFQKYAQSVSLDHAFDGQRSETWNLLPTGQRTTTRLDFQSGFRPLLGMNVQLKNGMNLTLRYNSSEQLSQSTSYGVGSTKQLSRDFTLTARYSKRSGFRLPMLKNKELKNSIDFQFNLVYGTNTTLKSRGLDGRFQPTAETSKWEFSPRVTYSFSTQVRGSAYLTVGHTKNSLMGETKIQELGISVQISIRGS
ncbi:MAG: cell surface protein SprA [candidate division KSB1 bacterium]|nr:cell surface protein SprA [candidate division KSB1 bacterium]